MFARADPAAPDRSRLQWPAGAPLAPWIGVLLAVTANDACAAALGNWVTSVGLFAAIGAVVAVKAWPADLHASALSITGAALVIAGGAAWLWKARAVQPKSHFTGAPRNATGTAPLPARDPTSRVAVGCLSAGPEREALLAEWRLIFVRLQRAWDDGATASLRALTTPEMLEELCLGLQACDLEEAAARTDVVTLRAELFAFEELTEAFVASVEFSGLMREAPGECAAPFKELWMLTKSKDRNSGWKLARHQALI